LGDFLFGRIVQSVLQQFSCTWRVEASKASQQLHTFGSAAW
jgi:hypothetical protein